MPYSWTEISGVPVETRSGQKVGKLVGLSLDTEAHVVAKYAVRRLRSMTKLLPDELFVDSRQVISLDDRRMVVADAAVPEAVMVAKALPEATPIAPVAMRDGVE